MSLIFKKSTAQPAFTVAAAITGTTEATQTLTCAYTVVRARAANVTVRWYRHTADDGTDPTGVLLGTGSTYVLTGTDVGNYIRAIVTAINPAGTVQSTTSYTAIITSGDQPTPPTIATAAAITGTADVDETLTVTADFDGETSITYQWYSYATEPTGSPLAGTDEVELGTASTQLLTASEAGRWIVAVVTATSAAGSAVTSDSVAMAGVDPWEPIAPTEYSPPAYDTTGMNFVYVYNGDDLQAAFNNAMPGDCLVLEAGATWTAPASGRFQFPSGNADGSDWIYVISSAMVDLPEAGVRVSPADAANMPKITTANTSTAQCLYVNRGVRKVRFVGIDFSSGYTSPTGNQYGLVIISEGGSGDVQDVIFDRCLIRGTTSGNCYSGLVWSVSTRTALINSHVTDFHTVRGESQAIAPFQDCSQILIENNYIAGASISVFIGGNTVTNAATDIVIRGNRITKEDAWNPNHASYGGVSWGVKNLLEIKAGSRILIEGNVLENTWTDLQYNGGPIAFVTWGAAIEDIKVVNNIMRNVDHVGFASRQNYNMTRVRVTNNIMHLFANTKAAINGIYARWFFSSTVTNGINYFRADHNTFCNGSAKSTAQFMYIESSYSTGANDINNLKVDHNIWDNGYSGLGGGVVGTGKAAIDYYCDTYLFRNNGTYRYVSGAMPPTTTVSGEWEGWIYAGGSVDSVGFTNSACATPADLVLLNTSPFYQQGDSGEDLGADISAILAATNDE